MSSACLGPRGCRPGTDSCPGPSHPSTGSSLYNSPAAIGEAGDAQKASTSRLPGTQPFQKAKKCDILFAIFIKTYIYLLTYIYKQTGLVYICNTHIILHIIHIFIVCYPLHNFLKNCLDNNDNGVYKGYIDQCSANTALRQVGIKIF